MCRITEPFLCLDWQSGVAAVGKSKLLRFGPSSTVSQHLAIKKYFVKGQDDLFLMLIKGTAHSDLTHGAL